MQYGEIRGREEDFEAFADDAIRVAKPAAPRRVDLNSEKLENGLTQLVLSLLELVRQLVEKQAMRRIEGGSLTDGQVEKLGDTLMRLEQQMEDLKAHFKIDSLNIDLGPLGPLIDEKR